MLAQNKIVLIYPEMAGTLQKVYVKKGDRVSKRTIIATIPA